MPWQQEGEPQPLEPLAVEAERIAVPTTEPSALLPPIGADCIADGAVNVIVNCCDVVGTCTCVRLCARLVWCSTDCTNARPPRKKLIVRWDRSNPIRQASDSAKRTVPTETHEEKGGGEEERDWKRNTQTFERTGWGWGVGERPISFPLPVAHRHRLSTEPPAAVTLRDQHRFPRPTAPATLPSLFSTSLIGACLVCGLTLRMIPFLPFLPMLFPLAFFPCCHR